MTYPLIGVVCCARMIDDDSDLHHLVFRSYIDYIKNELKAIPLLIPAIINNGDSSMAKKIVQSVDGLFLSGSPSNVSLRRKKKGGEYFFYETDSLGIKDLNRDITVMKILEHAYYMDKPVLGICRGFQEINVFFGGELHQELHRIPGKIDHRSDKSKPMRCKYEVSHKVNIEKGSLIERLFSEKRLNKKDLFVNSLHSQGVSTLGENLVVECLAQDNTIEAIKHTDASFIYGVQWHMEWLNSPLDELIANEFIKHCSK